MDKFYTVSDIAVRCVAAVSENVPGYPEEFDVVLEPSAGSGSFLKQLPISTRYGIDIEPDDDEIIKQDFLTEFRADTDKRYIVIGNPPFGRGSSLAIKFFNRAAMFADYIAFIVPRTFKRISVQNMLANTMHLMYSEDLPVGKDCFVPPMHAKCCFQIWRRDLSVRRIRTILPLTHDDFDFVQHGPRDERNQPTVPADAEIAVRAYGGRCGEIITGSSALCRLRPKSWHWIRTKPGKKTVSELIHIFEHMDFSISTDTVRQNSIGKAEFVYLYSEAKKKCTV